MIIQFFPVNRQALAQKNYLVDTDSYWNLTADFIAMQA